MVEGLIAEQCLCSGLILHSSCLSLSSRLSVTSSVEVGSLFLLLFFSHFFFFHFSFPSVSQIHLPQYKLPASRAWLAWHGGHD